MRNRYGLTRSPGDDRKTRRRVWKILLPVELAAAAFTVAGAHMLPGSMLVSTTAELLLMAGVLFVVVLLAYLER